MTHRGYRGLMGLQFKMKMNKKILGEGFATIIVATILSAIVTMLTVSGLLGVGLEAAPGFVGMVAGMIVGAIIMGIVIMSVVFLVIHLIQPNLSALIGVLVAGVILWVIGGGWGITSLALGVGMVVIGNFVAKRIGLDRKLQSMLG